MISIGVHSGGPELKGMIIENVLARSMSVAIKERGSNYKKDSWINTIFVLPGSVSKPDFEGFKLGHFSKKEKGLVVQIEVPQSVADGEGIAEFIGSSLREAVKLAAAHFASKGISFSTLKAEKIILAIEASLEKTLSAS